MNKCSFFIPKTLTCSTKYLAVFAIFCAWQTPFALQSTISINVVVDASVTKKHTVLGCGFAVNGSQYGGIGTNVTQTGPTGALYTFGFRGVSSNVKCQSAVLDQSSKALLYYSANKCLIKVTKL